MMDIVENTQKIIEEYIGPFLASLITKKAIERAGFSSQELTPAAMEQVVDNYILPALTPLLCKEKVQECRRKIELKLRGG